MTYTEEDLRNAFRAGWQEREKTPGLKRVPKRDGRNNMMRAIGGGKYAEHVYVPAHRKYHNSIWLRSSFRAAVKGGE